MMTDFLAEHPGEPPARVRPRARPSRPAPDRGGIRRPPPFEHMIDLASARLPSRLASLAGLHTSTWGMYKDAPHEGFTWRRYFRSPMVGAVMALIAYAVARPDLSSGRHAGRLLRRGLRARARRDRVLEDVPPRTRTRASTSSRCSSPCSAGVVHGRARRLAHRRWSIAGGGRAGVSGRALRRAGGAVPAVDLAGVRSSAASADGSRRFSARGRTRRSKASRR